MRRADAPFVVVDGVTYDIVAYPTQRDRTMVRCSLSIDLNINPEDIARNLLLLRVRAGLSQKQFAEALGVGHRTVSTWEANTQGRSESIPLNLLWRVAEVLKIPFGRLLLKD